MFFVLSRGIHVPVHAQWNPVGEVETVRSFVNAVTGILNSVAKNIISTLFEGKKLVIS